MFIFDAHLDLAMNAMEWNRDLTWSVESIRTGEIGMSDKPDRNKNTVSLRAMRKGNIGLCVATQIARFTKKTNPLPGWKSPQQAWAQTQGQLAWYNTMEDLGEMVQILNYEQLNAHLELWSTSQEKKPIGYILSLEGADSIITMDYLEKSYEQGLRAIGPAHYGPGTYAQGTNGTGGLGPKGKELLREIERLGLILDMSHLNDTSFWETMRFYNGPMWASHTNCRTLVDHNRQFSDEQIKELINRDAVIGMAMDAWMLASNWIRGMSSPGGLGVTLHTVIDHIDHICQLAGNSDHVGIGTDLDGGFGTEQCPSDIDTISDLQKIPKMLQKRGYSPRDIENIMHKNFLQFLQKTWK
ncbi:membrane dipeptidase [Maribacter sp. TH_r10]|uniref:dipeptidase n=1 Tax=Maribacter sp. TH_r10 TaxID=3082086 RepID=UPI00295520E5|nr:membrane dipeptidase [Maribacter sp. TH_r10]MDV7138031.1 membrane dipeptidase [Maribacter sp. TH_r10]